MKPKKELNLMTLILGAVALIGGMILYDVLASLF